MIRLLKPLPSRSVALSLVFGASLVMQPAAPARADDDQDRGSTYARVRYLEGGLTVQSTGQGEVVEAVANTPVVPGDSAWTGDGRAEIELADGSLLSLDAGTRIDVRNLADLENRYEKTTLIALEQGSLRIDASESSSSDKVFQIDTEGGSVYLLSGGAFRIDAEGSVCTVSQMRGGAELSGDGGSVLVRRGERSSAGRGRNPADPRPFNTLRQDAFDRFVEERGKAYLRQGDDPALDQVREQAPPEVDPYIGELATYGEWRDVPTYGHVWRPRYSGNWGPYVNGHWIHTPTGWVWVSYDPWGWALYHYGRWDFGVDIGWFWIPGEIWSGAWVSYAVGPSYIGWCRLNFYNRPVFNNVSVINVTNINVGRLDPRGWRFVSVDRFGVRGDRGFVRPDRLPRGTEVVVTGRLPRFEARQIGGRPEQWNRVVEQARGQRATFQTPGASDRPVPFRNLERRGEPGHQAVRNSARPAMPNSSGDSPRARVRGADPRTTIDRSRPRVGTTYGGPQAERRPAPSRERAQRPTPNFSRESNPGASTTPDRGRSMEPRRREDSRQAAPSTAPRDRTPARDFESPRPRARVVERVFNEASPDGAADRPDAPQRTERRRA